MTDASSKVTVTIIPQHEKHIFLLVCLSVFYLK